MTKLAWTAALAAFASVALAACGGGGDNGGGTTTAATTSSTTTAAGGGGASSTVKLSADPSQIAYQEKSLSAKAGAVTIDLTNPNSSLPHDVCVQTPGGQPQCSDTVTGGSTSLSLASLKPGNYTFYCSVDGHEAAGMKGTLTIK